jgi:hypothetical protein
MVQYNVYTCKQSKNDTYWTTLGIGWGTDEEEWLRRGIYAGYVWKIVRTNLNDTMYPHPS